VIFPEDVKLISPRFAAAGLTARLIESDDPNVEDDQIKIYRGNVDTRVTIQIALIGGGYYVNEYRGKGSSFVSIDRGSFRSLRDAIDRAIATVKAKQIAEETAS
jgi:hypothetical protein